VLDTNLVVSAYWTPGGLERRVLNLIAEDRLELCASPSILAEYESVMRRPKFQAIFPEWSRTFHLLLVKARIVHPSATLSVTADESDNRFLECAQAANADYLITGDLRHFPKVWGKTRILNARAFHDSVLIHML